MKKLLPALLALCFCAPAGARIVTGAERMNEYLPLLEGERVGVVTNHSGIVGGRHLVDTLLSRGVDIELVFAPEHGFRGKAAAGAHVDDTRDAATGLEIISLYGTGRKPKAADIARCDIILLDIQDVGCRFYTYLSTMHYVMEACAENATPLIVLDRPNPNGMYVDGPILDTARHRSFVGMHPIPIVHGMTLGELARMINGEGWLAGGRNADGGENVAIGGRLAGGGEKCDLTVIPCEGYTRDMRYELPIAPSPALPNMRAVWLYPSLCYFEATPVSVGRGTEHPFQTLIYPGTGGRTIDLDTRPDDGTILARGIDLSYLVDAWRELGRGNANFFTPFFENLIGVDYVRGMIVAGHSAEEIEARWAADVEKFKEQRKPYLIYEKN